MMWLFLICTGILMSFVCIMSDEGGRMLARLIVYVLGLLPVALVICIILIVFGLFA